MVIKTFVLTTILWSSSLFAATESLDRFNRFLWNRNNVIAKNGEIDQGDWYEWWYYKIVDPISREAFFFTYGIVNPWDIGNIRPGSRAILQFGSFKDGQVLVQDFPVQEFSSSYNITNIKIGSNQATDRNLSGKMVTADGRLVSWDLRMSPEWNFNAMGWGIWAKELTGIYWYPAQASARMSGQIQVGDRTIKLNDAPAYQDRNWGRTFPKWWTWITSNHFTDSPGSVLAAGGGKPMILDQFGFFQGLCIGLKHQNKDYTFRTTDGNSVKFEIRWGKWEIEAQNFLGQRISISAHAPQEKFLTLPFMTPQGKVFLDNEALLGHAEVKLYEWSFIHSQWELIADLQTEEAGIEWGSPEPLKKIFDGKIILD